MWETVDVYTCPVLVEVSPTLFHAATLVQTIALPTPHFIQDLFATFLCKTLKNLYASTRQSSLHPTELTMQLMGSSRLPAEAPPVYAERCSQSCIKIKETCLHDAYHLETFMGFLSNCGLSSKLLSLIYSCVYGTAPQCLSELIPLYNPTRILRSSSQSNLVSLSLAIT